MSSQETPPADRMEQPRWRMESMQLVNWGGFHGVVSIELSPDATLISGASGTGKSTILDAYLALMMDSNTPFNGASNDAASGRARGVTQRSLLTYLRGKLDDVRENGEAAERTLRGAASWTWGAVGATFVGDSNKRFTALRLYHVPRSASKDSDITKKLCTTAGVVDLKEFEPLADGRFDKRSIRSRFPVMDVHDTYDAFAVAVHRRLGIGANGDGSSALRLLARIQAGTPVTSIDGLYKSMVLEEPATFAAADRAIGHFADLEAAHDEMATADAKQKVLQESPEHWSEHETQSERASVIDALGLDRNALSPFAHWSLRFECELAEAALHGNREQRSDEQTRWEAARAEERTFAEQVKALETAIDQAGGGTLKALEAQITSLEQDHGRAVDARRALDEHTAVLDLDTSTRDQFTSAVGAAREFLDSGFGDQDRTLKTEREAIQESRGWPLRKEAEALEEERESLRGRDGRVPPGLHDARVDAAQAAGLQPGDLPFVAELIDVLPNQEAWRTAAEVVFGAVARVMLVDERHLDGLSRAIDHLRWRVRLNFEGIALRDFQLRDMDPVMLSGKLAYKDTQFTAWVQDRLTNPGTDALCVGSAADLNGRGPRVTRAGQTRDGKRGAHGSTNSPSIIGFDNKARLADIDARLAVITTEQQQVRSALEDLEAREAQLRESWAAHQTLAAAQWHLIDHQAIRSQVETFKAQRDAILESNDRLRDLEAQRNEAAEREEAASKRRHRAEDQIEHLAAAHAALQGHLVEMAEQIDLLKYHEITSDDEQRELLADRYEEIAGDSPYDIDGFVRHLAVLTRALQRERADAQQAVERAAKALRGVFERYQERWPDPNLGIAVDSYPDYVAILEEIMATGLHERLQEWVRRIAEWTGEDLLPLHGAFDTAIEDIQDRLAPVNAILETLPFGANRDRLRIDLRRLHHDRHSKFRSTLKTLSSGATGELTVDQAEAKFKQLRSFIDLIRPTEKGGEKSERDYFLDVRKHVELSASVVMADGTIRAEYRTLGGKSGGETQELVAFIVGAALRFQLGDETRSYPRFAPVLLDEGFIKADSEFAGRGVSAWKGLGFQLIVAAPFDKVTALEPHVERMLQVTKHPASGCARVDDLEAS
jgi:uncharacterized protein YPO0396